jgi:hypothetical protein
MPVAGLEFRWRVLRDGVAFCMNHQQHSSFAGQFAAVGREALMRRPLSKLLLTLALAALLFMPAAPGKSKAVTNDPLEFARVPTAVKLRKLHLVRPDLIPYPLFFEVYC